MPDKTHEASQYSLQVVPLDSSVFRLKYGQRYLMIVEMNKGLRDLGDILGLIYKNNFIHKKKNFESRYIGELEAKEDSER